ncbi:hypothetical protein H310_05152 [Aphanomyces invadans]|uniref:DUF8040 domain-containing protein n=1 Tax=Aphanomyces invadans TaxID=157072 RepID=A0A024UBK8_9STRA|nr:hypothetical protein H310_05152 [Aphanomyces invadans]ETW03786.1 hypothetical protein H310_05152 [Aphanomyces invadans]|eukprot:XP_008868015.1 hypothetical protein H310_05152 [Aphanomyces invadans]
MQFRKHSADLYFETCVAPHEAGVEFGFLAAAYSPPSTPIHHDVLYIVYHYNAYMLKNPSERKSILTGRMWVEEIVRGNPHLGVENFRITIVCFQRLVRRMEDVGGLRSTVRIPTTDQVAMLLYFAGHHVSSPALQERFQHSGESISRHLRAVLAALRRCVQFTFGCLGKTHRRRTKYV